MPDKYTQYLLQHRESIARLITQHGASHHGLHATASAALAAAAVLCTVAVTITLTITLP